MATLLHEAWLEIGLLITLALALLGSPFWLYAHSRRNHERRHGFHTELMCDYCTARFYSPELPPGEAYRRWPMRVLGDRPPRGTG